MDKSSIIAKVFEQHNIRQRELDGYLSATDMCKAFDTDISQYTRTKTTKEYISALESDLHLYSSQLIEIRKGNSSEFEQGTWVHPMVAIHLAQWLSPKFAIQVNRWVIRYLSGDITLVADVVKQYENVTGTKVSSIDFDYENKLLELEERRAALDKSRIEISKSKLENEQLQITLTERKKQLIIDLDLFKGDAQLYSVFKDTIMNIFGVIQNSNESNNIANNKDLSTLYYEALNVRPSSSILTKLGKKIKAEYIKKYNEQPLKAAKHVNGAIRDIYVYPRRDYEWIIEIIRATQ